MCVGLENTSDVRSTTLSFLLSKQCRKRRVSFEMVITAPA